MLRAASLKKLLVGSGIRDVARWGRPLYGHATGRSTIRVIGIAGANAATVNLPPGTQPGDLAIVWAHNSASTTTPTLPGTFTNINNGAANSISLRCGRRVIQAGDTSIGTWTNATQVVVIVLRGVNQTTPINGNAMTNGSASASVNFASLTLTDAPRSMVVMGGGHGLTPAIPNTDVAVVPLAGTENGYPLPMNMALHYVPKAASWTATAKTVNQASSWRTVVVEVAAAA